MKILVQGRKDILTKPGGDYFSINDKVDNLKDYGVDLDFNSDPNMSLEKYDLVHIQQSILNTYSVKLQLDNAIKWNKPVVFKPFYNSQKDTDFYLRNAPTATNNIIYKFLNDYYGYLKLRNIFYSLNNKDIIQGLRQFFLKYKREQIRIINNSYIIPDSFIELEEIKKELGINIRNYKIVNASLNINKMLDNVSPSIFKDKYGISNFIFCVGRIEPLKNQVNLLRAMQGFDIQVVIEGKMQAYHRSYNNKFKKLIQQNDNFHWIESISREMLISGFKNAKVVALPSWTETAGMTGLEGGYFDCNIVATERGACKEYFKESAWYLNPSKTKSIRKAVLDAYNSPKGCRSFKERISSDYSLQKTSQELFDAYCDAIKIHNSCN